MGQTVNDDGWHMSTEGTLAITKMDTNTSFYVPMAPAPVLVTSLAPPRAILVAKDVSF